MSPLEKFNCNYFYILSLFGFISFLTILSSFIYKKNRNIFRRKNKFYILAYLLSMPLSIYYVNRLLYSMCVKSL